MKFEKVNKYAAADFNLPVRKTKNSAGYDFEVVEDIVIPPYLHQVSLMKDYVNFDLTAMDFNLDAIALSDISTITKSTKAKPTLVPTGVKCQLEPGYYLELSVRSSTPLKYWLVLANGVGIIDADYWNNESNEGEIFFQVINLSPFPIQLKRGDIIGQGIIKKYYTVDEDEANGIRNGGFGSTSNAIDNAIVKGNVQSPTMTGIDLAHNFVDLQDNVKLPFADIGISANEITIAIKDLLQAWSKSSVNT